MIADGTPVAPAAAPMILTHRRHIQQIIHLLPVNIPLREALVNGSEARQGKRLMRLSRKSGKYPDRARMIFRKGGFWKERTHRT